MWVVLQEFRRLWHFQPWLRAALLAIWPKEIFNQISTSRPIPSNKRPTNKSKSSRYCWKISNLSSEKTRKNSWWRGSSPTLIDTLKSLMTWPSRCCLRGTSIVLMMKNSDTGLKMSWRVREETTWLETTASLKKTNPSPRMHRKICKQCQSI